MPSEQALVEQLFRIHTISYGTISNMLTATLERAVHLVGAYLETVGSDLGVTQAEAHVLARVTGAGAVPVADLHRDLGTPRSTLTSVLDRLERRGMIRRSPNPDDRRSILVELTPAGRRTSRRVVQVLRQLEHEVHQRVKARDVTAVGAVADALAAIVQPA